MEIQRGKEGMKKMQFNSVVGATAGCTLRSFLGTILVQDNVKKFGLEEMHGLLAQEQPMRLGSEDMKQYFKSKLTMHRIRRNSSKRH